MGPEAGGSSGEGGRRLGDLAGLTRLVWLSAENRIPTRVRPSAVITETFSGFVMLASRAWGLLGGVRGDILFM